MKKFFQVVFWTFWLTLCLIFNGVLFSSFDDKDVFEVTLSLLVVWWGITIIIALAKWKKYRKENPAVNKETRNFIKQMEYEKSKEYKKNNYIEIEVLHPFFGKGILIKDNEKGFYTDIKSGFDVMFNYLGKKENTPYDLYEFLVKPDNLNNVLDSLEKIYINSDRALEGCYDTIYNKIMNFYEQQNELLNSDFSIEYLKNNWYVSGIQIEDDVFNISLGINAGNNPEFDSNYEVIIMFDLQSQLAEVSFNVVW